MDGLLGFVEVFTEPPVSAGRSLSPATMLLKELHVTGSSFSTNGFGQYFPTHRSAGPHGTGEHCTSSSALHQLHCAVDRGVFKVPVLGRITPAPGRPYTHLNIDAVVVGTFSIDTSAFVPGYLLPPTDQAARLSDTLCQTSPEYPTK